MPASPSWVTSHPEIFQSLLASDRLAALDAACLQAAAAFLPGVALRESLFWVPQPELKSNVGWVLEAHGLSTGRYYLPRSLREDLQAVWREGEAVRILPGAPTEGMEPATGLGMLIPSEPDETRVTLAVRVGPAEVPPAAFWLLGLAGEPAPLGAEAREGLLQIAGVAGWVLPRLLEADQAQRQTRMIAHLHEAMLKVMLDQDPHSLLCELLAVLTRDFGLGRICILLVHAETHMLRGELHTGFSTNFRVPSLSLDQDSHPFVRALHAEGNGVLLHERREDCDAAPDWLVQGEGEAPARAVLLPLLLPHRAIGLIYADQPRHDGSPFFAGVFELFARLAAVAIHHQQQQGRAELRAETDPLTGLRNRYFLDKILEIEVPRVKRYNAPISLLMIDLVDFKRVNDHYGHTFGDFILRETANLLLACVRRGDVLVRFGGDEFVVLMVNTRLDQATQVRDRIERTFIAHNRMQTAEGMAIHISLGLRSAGADDIDSLLQEADQAMYAHKSRQTRRQLLESLVLGDLERIEAVDRMVASLCNILYKKEPFYPQHARRVTHLALRLAARLDMPPEEVETLALAALLHDVGKVSMPTEILQKREPLTDIERQAMRHHPALGEEFFQGVVYLDAIRPLIRHHHERYDGQMTGDWRAYPDGLGGERLPLAARILRLAESVDGMLNERPYRPALPIHEVIRILREEAGRSFDPRLVRLLLADEASLATMGEADAILALVHEDTL